MGKEFYDKGSNLQLGPGLNVARVPLKLGPDRTFLELDAAPRHLYTHISRNGRNFEYLSGDGLTLQSRERSWPFRSILASGCA